MNKVEKKDRKSPRRDFSCMSTSNDIND